MKKLVQRARHLSGAVAGAVFRAVDPPLSADARPIDIKRAIVEAVEQQVEPAGQGRRVLPGETVRVKVLAEQAETRRALEAVLADLRDVIAARLLELQCSVPPRFVAEVTYVGHPLAEWHEDQRLAVMVVSHEGRGAHRSDVPLASPTLMLTVLRGQAEKRQFVFTEGVIRIGRSADPTDDRGRPRFNDVAFLENDSPENRTVTRGHALIRFDAPTGEYRLFDEGSANGTRVVRGGNAIDVPKRDPVGLALRTGDEVQLGKAAMRVRIGTPE